MCLLFDSISSIYVLALHKVQTIGKNEIRKTLSGKNWAFSLEKKDIDIEIKNRPPVPENKFNLSYM